MSFVARVKPRRIGDRKALQKLTSILDRFRGGASSAFPNISLQCLRLFALFPLRQNALLDYASRYAPRARAESR